ncbi:unnamed protein product [Closterium sp. Yama58-4]|nr:unnamed protein product [Closterium sp. Yama58-4]
MAPKKTARDSGTKKTMRDGGIKFPGLGNVTIVLPSHNDGFNAHGELRQVVGDVGKEREDKADDEEDDEASSSSSFGSDSSDEGSESEYEEEEADGGSEDEEMADLEAEPSKGASKKRKGSAAIYTVVKMFGELAADETRKCKCCPTRISFKDSSTRSGGRHYEGKHNAHYAIWKRMYEGGLVPADATFPEGGYPGVPHSGEKWPYAEAYPNVPPEALVGGVAALGGGQATMEQFMTPRVSVRELRAAFVKFIVMTDSSYRIVDSDAFKEMLTVANSACGKDNVIPSRWTLARDVSRYADMARALARAELELEKEGDLPLFKVCFTTDIWSSEARRSYMVVTAHWISSDWQLRQATIDFSEMSEGHTGEDIAKRFEEVVGAWGLVGRCHGVTTDNASSNEAAIRVLSDDGDRFPLISKDMWFSPLMVCYVPTRCFAHVINLPVQKALAVETVKVPLQRIRSTAKFVGLSSKRMARFRKEMRDSFPTMKEVKLVLYCETRWGSTFAMVARALRLHRLLSAHFSQVQVSVRLRRGLYHVWSRCILVCVACQGCTVFTSNQCDYTLSIRFNANPPLPQGSSKKEREKYASLRLTDDHWDALVALKAFLAPFNAITKAAEGSVYPTVTTIVPYYNLLLDTLEKTLHDESNPPSDLLRDLIKVALPVLQKYYDHSTDELTVATFLDPGLKMAYFAMNTVPEVAQVPREQVLRLVRSRWAAYQAALNIAAARVASPPAPLVGETPHTRAEAEEEEEEEEEDEGVNFASRSSLLARVAASVEGGGVPRSAGDEIDRYMLEGLVSTVSPLEYWRAKVDMPVLKAMARDYLAIPASSAASERVFSASRNLITWQRHRLSADRICDSMTMRSFYASHPGVLLEEAAGRVTGGIQPAVDIGVEGMGPENM